MLPQALRERIWNTYRPGQEATMSPSREYLEAADAVQQWIASRSATKERDDPKVEVGGFDRPRRPATPRVRTTPPSDAYLAVDPDVRSHLARFAVCLATSPADVTVQLARIREVWSERAAIFEYLGGLTRTQAEHYAVNEAGLALGLVLI